MQSKLMRRSGVWCLTAIACALSLAAPGDSRLMQAVRSKDVEAVRKMIRERADVNAAQADGSTALHWAAHLDQLAIADALLRAGARADSANENGATPLHLACTNHSAPMVERLLAAGANANARLLSGETALMTCARTGEPKTVKALLSRGAEVNAKESGHDQTALMWAAAQKHPEVVRLLLEAGADFRARTRAYPQTVVNESTQRSGREELNYTVMRGGSTPLLFAARSGDAQSARLLLQAGADANDSLPDGMSALVLAAHSGQGDVGIALLEKGADPNSAGKGYTALHAAALRSQLGLVKALMARGADSTLRTTKGTPIRRQTTDFNLPQTLIGSTPYQLAARFVEVEIMQAMVEGGADPKLAMADGTTPLMLAAGQGSRRNASRRGISGIDVGGEAEPESRILEAVAMAVKLGGDINAPNNTGDTALHVAAANGYNSVIQYLADHGAQVNAKNKRGQTPLAALLSGGAGGRGRGRGRPVAADADADSEAPARGGPNQSTAALLKKLGATE